MSCSKIAVQNVNEGFVYITDLTWSLRIGLSLEFFFGNLTIEIVWILRRDAGTGGQEGQPPPLPFTRRGKGGKGALSI
jgi:hypothetical protein